MAFVAERLRRQTRNLLGSPRVSSNLTECVFALLDGSSANDDSVSVGFLVEEFKFLSFAMKFFKTLITCPAGQRKQCLYLSHKRLVIGASG